MYLFIRRCPEKGQCMAIKEKTMEFIVAVDQNWGIGKEGGMLDHLPKDLAFFKEKTTGHVIVMGRKTLESFPGGRPLPDRLNIVLTTQPDYEAAEGVVLVHSLRELSEKLAALGREDVFLVGGANMYARLKDSCSGGYVTHIDHAYEGAEAFFPDLEKAPAWELEKVLSRAEDHGRALTFCHYRNHSVTPLEALL